MTENGRKGGELNVDALERTRALVERYDREHNGHAVKVSAEEIEAIRSIVNAPCQKEQRRARVPYTMDDYRAANDRLFDARMSRKLMGR